MDEISVKLQAAVSDTKIFMAKQRDEIERLRGVVGTFSVAPNEATLRAEQAREIRRLESIIETFAGTNDELAQKDTEIEHLKALVNNHTDHAQLICNLTVSRQEDRKLITQLQEELHYVKHFSITQKVAEINRLHNVIDARNNSIYVLGQQCEHHKTALAQKDAEIARLSSENAMLRSGDAYLVGEAVCGSFTAACDAAITMGVPVTILKSVYQPVCQWVPA